MRVANGYPEDEDAEESWDEEKIGDEETERR